MIMSHESRWRFEQLIEIQRCVAALTIVYSIQYGNGITSASLPRTGRCNL